jgi:hypothetical protein
VPLGLMERPIGVREGLSVIDMAVSVHEPHARRYTDCARSATRRRRTLRSTLTNAWPDLTSDCRM